MPKRTRFVLTQIVILIQAARTPDVGGKRLNDVIELVKGGLCLKLRILLPTLWV